MESDAELVKATIAGDNRAFERLVRRYERSVRAVALDVSQDRHLSQDVAQEAFLRAYRQLETLRRPAVFGPWLMRIARRCAVDAVRRRRSESPLAEELVENVASHNGRLEEDKQLLLAAVMGLPDGERQVVLLRYFGGHAVRDVARIAGRSVGTVTKQLSRAHRRLRNTLKES